jgi:hypothetical protein
MVTGCWAGKVTSGGRPNLALGGFASWLAIFVGAGAQGFRPNRSAGRLGRGFGELRPLGTVPLDECESVGIQDHPLPYQR